MNKKDQLDQAVKAMNKAVSSKSIEDRKQEEFDIHIGKFIGKEISFSNKGIKEKMLTPEEVLKPVKKAGRPKLIDKAMEVRLIRLAEEYFFIRSIAGEAGISHETIERYLSEKENEEFTLSFTQARDRWITDKQTKLEAYATTKSVNDWRAMQYLLTIADKEYSERKYLTEAVANQDAKILMLIKAEQLVIAGKKGKEMLEKVINTPSQGEEAISLLPFKPEDPKNKLKAKTVKNKGQNGSPPPSR